MPITINALEVENVKRVKAVALQPSPTGLTVIGGKNGAGKTTVLDAITWALAGDRYRPSEARRDGSMTAPHIKVTLSNGLIVERKGKNSALTVTDPTGKRAGQQLINELISTFALDLPKFLAAPSKEKADTLLQIIGIGPQLRVIDDEIAKAYNKRTAVGQIRDSKAAYAAELPEYIDAPETEISVSELSAKLAEILKQNAENERTRKQLEDLREKRDAILQQIIDVTNSLNALCLKRDALLTAINEQQDRIAVLHDEDPSEIEEQLADAENTNARVRANLTKAKAQEDADAEAENYKTLTRYIDQKRQERIALLEGADLPLQGLTVEEGELRYKGHSWDCLSSAEQLRVATAIIRKLNPNTGFVLLDKLEQMDLDTMREFGEWLEHEGLQAIATRVSTGSECQIIIENGTVLGAEEAPEAPKWKKGEF